MLPYRSHVLFLVQGRPKAEDKAFNNIKPFETEGSAPDLHDREKRASERETEPDDGRWRSCLGWVWEAWASLPPVSRRPATDCPQGDISDFQMLHFCVKKQPCILAGNEKEAKSPGRKGLIVSPVTFILGLY